MDGSERREHTEALTRRTTPEEAAIRRPAWAEGLGEPPWVGPPRGERWEEFLTGLYGGAELWEYCIPFRGETGEGGYAIVRDGEVVETYVMLIA